MRTQDLIDACRAAGLETEAAALAEAVDRVRYAPVVGPSGLLDRSRILTAQAIAAQQALQDCAAREETHDDL